MPTATRNAGSPTRRAARKPHLRLVVALPFVTGLLAFAVGVYAFQIGRYDATAQMSPEHAARVWATLPDSWFWVVAVACFGAIIGLAIALAFTRQLHTLAKRTEFLARRNYNYPVELEADGEVAPLVSAINELLESVRDYARHSVADGMISFGRDGRVLSINPRAAVAIGVDADGVIGQSFRRLIPDVPENHRLKTAFLQAFDRGQAFDVRELRWVNTRGQHMQVDLQGTVLAGEEPIISVQVVFERAPDLESVQREVSRAHRLMVVGGFSAELAHEIRNPLSSVFGLVDLLHERLPDGDEGHAHLDVLARAAGRIEALVKQLLDLVPTEIQDLEERDLNGLVHEAVEFAVVAEAPGRVQIHQEYAEGLAVCNVDADRITRLFDNLLRNALAHTPDGGTISIATGQNDATLFVRIHNTGSFVALEDRERIFQPFVSGRGTGTGLGLAIAQQIAYAHGGTIEVESSRDDGTEFTVTLPVRQVLFADPTPAPTEALAGAA
ncbi:MAG: PAS domain S-box protein [Acidobacteria bacterium]|nr:PAS domain S-box protein [Acidobacteriota bacterium]